MKNNDVIKIVIFGVFLLSMLFTIVGVPAWAWAVVNMVLLFCLAVYYINYRRNNDK